MSQVTITKNDLIFVQKRGLIRCISDVEKVWNHLLERGTVVGGANTNQTTSVSSFVAIPPLQRGLKSRDSSQDKDAIIAFSKKNGVGQASLIKGALQAKGFSVAFAQEPNEIDLYSCEQRIANSSTLIVILTSEALKQIEVVFAMTAAQYYYKSASQVILVHDAGSCFFPGYDEQPPELVNLFSEKAVTFLDCYAEVGIEDITTKIRKEIAQKNKAANETQAQAFQHLLGMYEQTNIISVAKIQDYLKIPPEEMAALIKEIDQNHDGFVNMEEFSRMFSRSPKFASLFVQEEHHEDISTRVFLSHKRSSGQAIAGRLFENLKEHYSIFLDSEAKFQIHNLKQLVEQTAHFVLILSHGIFLSKWCLEELKSAVANKKPISVVRDLGFTLPATLPPDWAEFESIIRKDQLVWMAEYNKACVDALVKRIGPSDQQLTGAAILTTPKRLDVLKSTGTLQAPSHMTNCLAATCIKLQELGLFPHIRTLDCRGYAITNEDMALLAQYKIKFPNLEAVRIVDQRGLKQFLEWIAKSESDLRILECGTHSNHVSDAELELIGAYRNLREVSLSHVDCTIPGMLNFFRKVPNLRSLTLRYIDPKVDNVLIEGLAQYCPDLESLDLQYPEVSGRLFQRARFPSLRTFICQGMDTWTGPCDVAYEDLANAAPNLVTMQFDCWNTESETITAEGLKIIGTKCPKIESLVCIGTEQYLAVLPDHFRNLKILETRGGPTDEGLKFIGKIPKLEEITFVGDAGTDAGLRNLAPALPRMKKMKFLDWVKITDDGISNLLSQATNLEMLGLLGCRVTPAAVLANLSKNIQWLEIQTVVNDFKATFADLDKLATFPKLKRLVATPQNTSDLVIPHILPLLNHVEDAAFGACPEMTKKGITQLISNTGIAKVIDFRNLKFKEFDVVVPQGSNATVVSRQVNLQYQKKNPDCNLLLYFVN